MTGQKTQKDVPRSGDANVLLKVKPGRELSIPGPTDFTHPYYWAPFILIGNGL
jgi:CHAT domain-containing protein